MLGDVERLLARARDLASEGDLEEALDCYAALCEREPYNPDLWLERTGIAESAGRAAEAVDMLFHVAELFAQAGMAEAAELAKRVLVLDPGHAGARAFLDTLDAGTTGLLDPDGHDTGHDTGHDARHDTRHDAIPEAIGDDDDDDDDDDDRMLRSVPVPVLDAVPVAIFDEPTGWNVAAIPLPAVDMPSGPMAGFSATARPGRARLATPLPFADGLAAEDARARELAERVQSLASPLLDVLDSAGRDALIAGATLHRRRRLEAVFHQGDAGSSLYLVLEGTVDVERHGPHTGTIRRLATLDRGAFFGEMALIAGVPRSATVRAASNVVLAKLSRSTVRELSETNDRLLAVLTRFFRARLVATLVATSPLFEPLSAAERRGLITRFKLRELPADRVVLRQGHAGDGLYLVLVGSLSVTVAPAGRPPRSAGKESTVSKATERLADATEPTALGVLGPGDVFGEMSLLSGEPVMATIRARERAWVLRLPREDFAEVVRAHPELGDALADIARARKAENEASGTLCGPR